MPGLLTVEEIESEIRRGSIDTVIAAFPDHLGRLVGKRIVGDYFLDHVLTRPLHACAYLLTVDMEMTPLSGFDLTSWDKGYGDFRLVPDLSTLRQAAWLEKTAVVLCDVESDNGDELVEEAPRNILKQQVDRAAQQGFRSYMGTELEFYLYKDPLERIRRRGFSRLHAATDYIVDYHILASTYDESVLREIRNKVNSSGIPVEFSKGEWGAGQHEINLRYAESVEMADRHVLYKNAAKEIAWQAGHSLSFMAKIDKDAAGSSCHIHSSLVDAESGENSFWDSEGPSDICRKFVGGLLRAERELALLFAPTINSYKRYQSGSFAPTAIAWSRDNRTTCLRTVGEGASFRVENRLPGADVNPYLAMAATLAAGLWGIETNAKCPDLYAGDAYNDTTLERVPRTLDEAVALFQSSEIAASAFSERLRRFLVKHALVEIEAFQNSVTDWERRRYFERI